MARNAADDCMFCAPGPCACAAKPAKRVSSRAKPLVVPATPAVVAENPSARPRRAGLGAVRSLATPIERPKAPIKPLMSAIPADREDTMTSAIRVLFEAGLIDADEVRKHRSEMKMSDTALNEMLIKGVESEQHD